MEKYDVIVVGGGPTGIGASIGAARVGAKTILVERYGFLGGMATAGLVTHWDPIDLMEITGVAKEIYDELKANNLIKEFPVQDIDMRYTYYESGCTFDPEVYKYLAMEKVENERVKFLFHSFAVDVIKEGNRVKGIVTYSKSGRQEIFGKTIVDATGDGDMAARAGAPYQKGTEDGELMSPSMCFTIGGVNTEELMRYVKENPTEIGYHPRLKKKFLKNMDRTVVVQGFHELIRRARQNGDLTIPLPEQGIAMVFMPRKGEFHINAIRTPNIDGTNVEDLTRGEISERKNAHHLVHFMQKYIPGCQNTYILSTPAQIGIRETRRIKGDYYMTVDDVRHARKFEDAIMHGRWAHQDVHSGKDMKWRFEFIEGPYQVPYRCLLPQGLDNVIVGGRCIWVEREVLGTLRSMPQCMETGQAAGVAAALAAKLNQSFREIEVNKIQEKLREQGVRI